MKKTKANVVSNETQSKSPTHLDGWRMRSSLKTKRNSLKFSLHFEKTLGKSTINWHVHGEVDGIYSLSSARVPHWPFAVIKFAIFEESTVSQQLQRFDLIAPVFFLAILHFIAEWTTADYLIAHNGRVAGQEEISSEWIMINETKCVASELKNDWFYL